MNMWHALHTELDLPHDIEAVFDFFSRAENLEAITPRSLRFNILTPLPIEMKAGTLIDYQMHLSGVPMRWRTLISEWSPPFAFTDEQLKGPYRRWIHRHSFERLPEGATRMKDHVRYQLPLTPLGELAYPLIRRQVRQIFSHRNAVIPRMLEERYPRIAV